MNIFPFRIQVPDTAVEDLKRRLVATRWPDEVNDDAWSYGVRRSVLRELMDYWRTGFDWRAQEARLNTLPQFKADVGGHGVHFVHQCGVGPDPLPLIITHGWPSSFAEMVKIIPLLADPDAHGGDPADAFHVIAPSLPGYGFSDRPAAPGMSPPAIAAMWAELMGGLGYGRYGVQGGDWGATVGAWMARNHPDPVVGLHLNMLAIIEPPLGPGQRELTPAERAVIDDRIAWMAEEGGYGHIQGTKPQTLAYALNDSPVGLAAWILEKFHGWSDCGGDPLSVFSADELLTNISIYWFTETISSSIRIYKERSATPFRFAPGEQVKPPLGFARFPKDVAFPPREWAERVFTVAHWTDMPRGGHFPALEQPELLVDDIRRFFRPLRET